MASYRDAVAFVVICVLWGMSFPATEVLLSAIPPLLVGAFRFDIAAVGLLGYAVASGHAWRPSTRDDLLAIVGGGLFFIAIGNGVWIVGQNLITAAFSGLMVSLIPVMTAVCSWVLIPGDRLSPSGVVGLCIGFLGAFVLLIPDSGPLLDAGVIGKLLIFSAAVGTAIGNVLLGKAEASISSAAVTAWSMLVGGVLLHASSLGVGETLGTVPLTPTVLLALAYVSTGSSVVAYVLYFDLLARRSAVEMSFAMYVIPVVAAAGGWFLFDDPITSAMVTGFLLIVVGIVLLKRRAIIEELRYANAVG